MSLEKMNSAKNDILTRLKISSTTKREENFQFLFLSWSEGAVPIHYWSPLASSPRQREQKKILESPETVKSVFLVVCHISNHALSLTASLTLTSTSRETNESSQAKPS